MKPGRQTCRRPPRSRHPGLRGTAARPVLDDNLSAGPGGIVAAHAEVISHCGGRQGRRRQTNR